MELFAEIDRENGGSAVVGDAFEDFREVRDPKSWLEAFANFFQALGKGQKILLAAGRQISARDRRRLYRKPLATPPDFFSIAAV
jgi:hypothetical protein